jgi:hypothetical protein
MTNGPGEETLDILERCLGKGGMSHMDPRQTVHLLLGIWSPTQQPSLK